MEFGNLFALSPDGTRLIYTGPGPQLWMRSLGSLESEPLPLTEWGRTPFFSPDGESWGFHQGIPGDDRLRVVTPDAQAPVTLVEGLSPGVTWGEDGFVYYRAGRGEDGGGIQRVRAEGGDPELVLPDDSAAYWYPQVLPDGRTLLANRTRLGDVSWVAFDLESREIVKVEAGSHPRLVNGWLFWLNPESTLMAASFDPRSLELERPATPVATDVAITSFGVGHYDVSETGTLVYRRGPRGLDQAAETVVWRTRDGRETVAIDRWPVASDPDGLALSPDGSRVALLLEEGAGGELHVWTHDLGRGSWTRLTTGRGNAGGVQWKPSGDTVTILARENDATTLLAVPADGSEPPEPLASVPFSLLSVDWHPDGERFVAGIRRASESWDVALGAAGPEGFTPVVATDAEERGARLSPDGRWVAYVSDRSGPDEVYVRPLSGDGLWTVSRNGGTAPAWSPAGDELFYVNGERELVAVDFSADPDPTFGSPEVLFSVSGYEFEYIRGALYDVASDGERFLMIKDPSGEAGDLVVVQGLFTELEDDDEGGR
jgi:Tol biopolymer transport system component